jgi:hypothetical protein
VAATVVLVTGCTDEADETPADPTAGLADADGDEAADLPGVTVVDPDEADEATGGIDALVAASAEAAPDGWDTTVVADPALGPWVVTLPPDAAVWRVGDDPAVLEEVADGTAWWRYWEPILADAGEVADSSTLRAAIVLPGVADGDDAHVTVTVTPAGDLDVDDADAVAEFFAGTFAEQDLTVETTGTVEVDGRDVGAVVLRTPDDEFDDGVPRQLEQWFLPEAGDTGILWSTTCEAPVPAAEAAAEVCDAVLRSTRTPPR